MVAETKSSFLLTWNQHFLTFSLVDFSKHFWKRPSGRTLQTGKQSWPFCQRLAIAPPAPVKQCKRFSESSETGTLKLCCKGKQNFKCYFWQRVTFNLAESYIWPTSLPAPRLRSEDKGQWEVVPCGNASTLHWEPEPSQHAAGSGEHLGVQSIRGSVAFCSQAL